MFFANLRIEPNDLCLFTKVNITLMKHYLGIAVATVTLLLSSFSPAYSIDDVLKALRSGNATQLAKYFDTRVDISLPNKSDNFSRNQAEMILRDFFCDA